MLHKAKLHNLGLKIICDVANCTESTLEVEVRSVQQQLNSFDCGVFSVAFLLDVLDGNNEKTNYNSEKMRCHFLSSLKNTFFSPFPKSTNRSKVCASTILIADVYCICHWPFFEYEIEQEPEMFMANSSNGTSGIFGNMSLLLKTFLKIVY